MRLEPTPKPVRIRIKSAGIEHSSVQSLLQRYNYEDIRPLLKDGRFSRWLRQISQIELANRIEEICLTLKDKDGELKYAITGALFGVEGISDEVSLLNLFFQHLSVDEYNFEQELSSIPEKELATLINKRKLTSDCRSKIALALGLRTKDTEDRLKYLRKAANLGENRAEELLKHEEAIATGQVQVASLKDVINDLTFKYLNSKSAFPDKEVYDGPYLRYYLFFRFAFELRHSSNLSISWAQREGGLSYWMPYKDIIDSYYFLYDCYEKYKSQFSFVSKSQYSTGIINMVIPYEAQGKRKQIKAGDLKSFHNAIDTLCKYYWEYLQAQNTKLNLW